MQLQISLHILHNELSFECKRDSVLSKCVFQLCTLTVQILNRYNKSRIDNILVIKHILFICFYFPLHLRILILLYGQYIVQCKSAKDC